MCITVQNYDIFVRRDDNIDRYIYTLPETNSSHLNMDGWNTSFLLGWPIFRGYVTFREGRLWYELKHMHPSQAWSGWYSSVLEKSKVDPLCNSSSLIPPNLKRDILLMVQISS